MKKFKLNLKTTLAGILAGAPILINGILEKDVQKIVEGAGIILVGFFAKDAKTLDQGKD